MNAMMLSRALESEFRERTLGEGFDAIVASYYEEYTDATELDDNFASALETVFDICFPSGETLDGRDFATICRKTS